MSRAEKLAPQKRYRLIELLDPENITHYEFFLGKPPLVKQTWEDDHLLQQAKPSLNPCLFGWPSNNLLDYQFKPVTIDDGEFAFMKYCAKNTPTAITVADILTEVNLSLEQVRSLRDRQLIMLSR
jgi:hypothetical protein